jgi:hypothetical protein
MAPGIRELLDFAALEDWIAEEPEAHLLPHIRRTCEDMGLDVLSATTEDAVLVVRIGWSDTGPVAEQREATFRIVGSFAEAATSVRVREGNGVFEVVTGMLEGDSHFDPHGHMVRFEFVPA